MIIRLKLLLRQRINCIRRYYETYKQNRTLTVLGNSVEVQMVHIH